MFRIAVVVSALSVLVVVACWCGLTVVQLPWGYFPPREHLHSIRQPFLSVSPFDFRSVDDTPMHIQKLNSISNEPSQAPFLLWSHLGERRRQTNELQQQDNKRHSSWQRYNNFGTTTTSWFVEKRDPEDFRNDDNLRKHDLNLLLDKPVWRTSQTSQTSPRRHVGYVGRHRRRLSNVTLGGSSSNSSSNGFSISQPNKQGVPKYGNCDDDIRSTTGPCTGYVVSTTAAPSVAFGTFSFTNSPAATPVPTSLAAPHAPTTRAPTMVFGALSTTKNPAPIPPTAHPKPSAPFRTGAPSVAFGTFSFTNNPASTTPTARPKPSRTGAPSVAFGTFSFTNNPASTVPTANPKPSAPLRTGAPSVAFGTFSFTNNPASTVPTVHPKPPALSRTGAPSVAFGTFSFTNNPASTVPTARPKPSRTGAPSVAFGTFSFTSNPASATPTRPHPSLTPSRHPIPSNRPSSVAPSSEQSQNIIQLAVIVLQSSNGERNLSPQVAFVMDNILSSNTPFRANPANYTFTSGTLNSSIFLLQDPNASDTSLLRTLSPTISWRQYGVGYRCYDSATNSPIQNATTLQEIYSICLAALDESIVSGIFLQLLAADANQSQINVLNVTIPGMESFNESKHGKSESAPQRSFAQPLSTQGFDLRQWLGLGIAAVTVGTTALLMFLGNQREEKRKKEKDWGFPLATEEDVGNFLNMGFQWSHTEGQEGPPNRIVVFDKAKLGYRDDDSTLLGGYRDSQWVMDTAEVTLPSSGSSRDASQDRLFHTAYSGTSLLKDG